MSSTNENFTAQQVHTGKELGIMVICKDSFKLIFIYNNGAHGCKWGAVETNQFTFIHVNGNELEFQLIRLFYARQARRYYVLLAVQNLMISIKTEYSSHQCILLFCQESEI